MVRQSGRTTTYTVIDIFSRYVPGWMLAHAENAQLAEALLEETILKHGIGRGQLTLHSDRGSPMIEKPVAHLLADLGVTKSHSRPHCSNDNPHIERVRLPWSDYAACGMTPWS